MRNTLALALIAGLCSVTLGVNANWGEEMNGAPDPAFWSLTGGATPVDYTSRPGSWYGAGLGLNMANAAVVRQPLFNKAAYTVDWRFRYSPFTTPRGQNMSVQFVQECLGTQAFNFSAGRFWSDPDDWTALMDSCSGITTLSVLASPGLYGEPYTTPFVAEEWHLARVVCDPVASTLTLYIDGAQVYQFPYGGPKTPEEGSPIFAFGNGWQGMLPVEWDYIRTYDGVLTNPGTDVLNASPDRLTITPTVFTLYENALSGPTSATYSIVLKSQPSADVTIAIDPNDPGLNKLTAVPASLTFTNSNWSTPQSVTLTVLDTSGKTTASRTATVKHHVTSTDQNFDGETKFGVVTIYHDDIYAVVVDFGDGVTVAEQGQTTDTYTVQLLKQWPPSLYSVTLKPQPATGYANQVTLPEGAAGVTWTRTLWYQKKTIQVTAINDAVFETPNPYPVVINNVVSGPPEYAGMAAPTLTASVYDNDCGTWGFNYWDFNHDCKVDQMDLNTLAANWLKCTQPFGAGCVDLH